MATFSTGIGKDTLGGPSAYARSKRKRTSSAPLPRDCECSSVATAWTEEAAAGHPRPSRSSVAIERHRWHSYAMRWTESLIAVLPCSANAMMRVATDAPGGTIVPDAGLLL